MTARIEPADRALIVRVAEVLIPAGDGLPGGGEVLARAVLPDDAPLLAGVHHALRFLDAETRTGAQEAAALGLLRAVDRPAHDALLFAIVLAYYGDPAVRARVGYPGPRPVLLPAGVDLRDAALAPLLARVVARGAIYRETSPS